MKNDPNIIGNKKLELLILLLPFAGLIFLLIGGINIFKIISNKKKKERLIKTGTVIEATYIETNTNFNLRVLGRNPSNIICEYDDPISKNTYRFKSERLWYDPTLYIGDNDIYTFNVYVNKGFFGRGHRRVSPLFLRPPPGGVCKSRCKVSVGTHLYFPKCATGKCATSIGIINFQVFRKQDV